MYRGLVELSAMGGDLELTDDPSRAVDAESLRVGAPRHRKFPNLAEALVQETHRTGHSTAAHGANHLALRVDRVGDGVGSRIHQQGTQIDRCAALANKSVEGKAG